MADEESQSAFFKHRPWRHRKTNVALGREAEIKVFYEAPEREYRSDSIHWVEHAPPTLPAPRKLRLDGAAIQVYQRIEGNAGVLGNTPCYKPSLVKLQSPYLRTALDPLLEPHGALPNEFEGVTEIKRPFAPLLFERTKIEELADTADDIQLRKHLQLLVTVIHDVLGPLLDEIANAEVTGDIIYDNVWALFPAKELIVSGEGPYIEGAQVKDAWYINNKKEWDYHFQVDASVIGYNGLYFGLQNSLYKIDEYEGKKKITELPVYPLRFHKDPAGSRQRFCDRAKRVVGFQTITHALCRLLEEDGTDVASARRLDNFWDADQHIGRVMVDFAGFERRNPHQRRAIKPLPEYKEYGLNLVTSTSGAVDSSEDPRTLPRESVKLGAAVVAERIACSTKIMHGNEEYLFMLLPELRGFSFATNSWESFNVDQLSRVNTTPEAWGHLVMNTRKKDIISSLVECHGLLKTFNEDVISGKGQGLLILLSGPPGVGKTLCAEAIAEKARRPLYCIHPDDLWPDRSESMHTRLSEIMKRANDWNAILLFDEADVFLQKQDMREPREDMVSAFLWHLEHHKGVVFLITNHPDKVDAAIESRAHIHVPFPGLDKSSRRLLWTRFLNRIPDLSGKFSEHDLDDLARWKLNGRQIRNTLSMLSRWTTQSKTEPSLASVVDMIDMTCPSAVKEAADEKSNETVVQNGVISNGALRPPGPDELVDLMD